MSCKACTIVNQGRNSNSRATEHKRELLSKVSSISLSLTGRAAAPPTRRKRRIPRKLEPRRVVEKEILLPPPPPKPEIIKLTVICRFVYSIAFSSISLEKEAIAKEIDEIRQRRLQRRSLQQQQEEIIQQQPTAKQQQPVTIKKKIVPSAKTVLEDESLQKVTKQQIEVNKVYATLRCPYQIRNVIQRKARFVYAQHNTVTATVRMPYGIRSAKEYNEMQLFLDLLDALDNI
jgi:hypothetical protein